jgi:glycosyltransferase involved in cell wall biosynthesis
LEAMACGAPVVASDVGGLSFIVRDGETGYLVPEGDSEAMAECLLRLLHDPDLRRRLGANGVLAAREYTWPVIADRIVGLYDTVMQPARGGQKQNA